MTDTVLIARIYVITSEIISISWEMLSLPLGCHCHCGQGPAIMLRIARRARLAGGGSALSRRSLSSEVAEKTHPLRVCVVGSGPAGFYATKYLLKERADVRVDMLEALPTPYGA
jgi:NADPH-dependent 2,4-dienoyl-CoA reductase/sulfur reductase-like enzyme